jgi:hypothetical protein
MQPGTHPAMQYFLRADLRQGDNENCVVCMVYYGEILQSVRFAVLLFEWKESKEGILIFWESRS